MSSLYLLRDTNLANNRYKIQKVIGVGGFGCVYLALDKNGTRYAIKECFDQNRVRRSDDGQTVITHTEKSRNAKREHEHQRKNAHEEALKFGNNGLRHPNLVPIYESFDQFGTTYLVMPYVDGIPLHEVANKLRDGNSVLSILHQIGSALKFLHSNNLIHRDLKPDNVLIVGEDTKPVLLDTGATRDFNNTLTVHTGIQTDFGPPEIASSMEASTYGSPGPWSDCFALAGMAYLLISGTKPAAWTERALKLRQKENRDPLNKPEIMPDPVWLVVKKSLSLRTTDRHPCVTDFLSDFSLAISSKEIPKSQIKEEAPKVSKEEKINPVSLPPSKAKCFSEILPCASTPVAMIANLAIHFGFLLACWLIFDDPISAIVLLLVVMIINWATAIYLIFIKTPFVWASFPGINVWLLLKMHKTS